MKNPLVSIIIPCYNQAQYLDEALQSVLGQSCTNWECIIVNDGSLDDTEQVAEKWIMSDIRFRYLFQENKGLSSARNLGLDNSMGNYIQFLDSDDVIDFRKLELSLGKLGQKENGARDLIISNFLIFENDLKNPSKPYCDLDLDLFTFKSILYQWDSVFTIPIHCGLFEASFFNDFRFPEDLKAKEDWIMWLSFFKKEHRVTFINEPLAFYRFHQNSMTKKINLMLENKINSIVFLKNLISEKDYSDFLIYSLQNKYSENIQLRNSIVNYKNSKSYKIVKQLQSIFLLRLIFKGIK